MIFSRFDGCLQPHFLDFLNSLQSKEIHLSVEQHGGGRGIFKKVMRLKKKT